jgi:hypothetical protein
MTLQAAAITKTFAAKLAPREIVDKQMAEEETAKKVHAGRRRRRSAGRKAGPSSRQVRSSG